VLALEEMTGAEKAHGYIARAEDADPYLAKIRQAVAREAQTYSGSYREGTGEGLRYTAFDRYAKLTRQSVARMRESERSLKEFRERLKPLDPTDAQLRGFRQVYDAIPWAEVEETLHQAKFELPVVPAYTDFIDHSVTGQEDLLLAFSELFVSPNSRHVFAFALAAFIDVIVFLLAYASGPFFFGAPEQRWLSGGAALDSVDEQIFVRDFLRKLTPGARGMPQVEISTLSPGERQLCLVLAAREMAAPLQEDGKEYYLLDHDIHAHLVESLATRGFPLRASSHSPVMGT
jgi:hypothetical protein